MATTTTKKSTTTRTRKATPAKPKAQPKPKAEPKVPVSEEDKDWTYLLEREATDLHVNYAKWIADRVGLDVSDFADDPEGLFLKVVQIVCVTRMPYQRSSANKQRSTYRPLAAEVVKARSEAMEAAHQQAKAEIEARKAAETKPKRTAKKAAAPAPAKPAARKRTTPAKKSV